jgi:hypothetical protein
MPMRVIFVGGPMESMRASVEVLSTQQVFLDRPARKAFVYLRVNETTYAHDKSGSEYLTLDWGTANRLFGINGNSVIEWY